MAVWRVRPLGACYTGSEVTVRFLYSDLVLVGFGIFRLSLACQNLFAFSDLHIKWPLKFFREGIFPWKKFHRWDPKRPFLGWIRVVWRAVRANRFSSMVCRTGNAIYGLFYRSRFSAQNQVKSIFPVTLHSFISIKFAIYSASLVLANYFGFNSSPRPISLYNKLLSSQNHGDVKLNANNIWCLTSHIMRITASGELIFVAHFVTHIRTYGRHTHSGCHITALFIGERGKKKNH
jgi:hypothetical protein